MYFIFIIINFLPLDMSMRLFLPSVFYEQCIFFIYNFYYYTPSKKLEFLALFFLYMFVRCDLGTTFLVNK